MALNWDAFAQLPGSTDSNFEMLCRALVRRQYGQYGDFKALSAQPGIEFHLKLNTACSLGSVGRWLGWQCRWYDLPSGRAIGNNRRQKIEKAIRTTEKVLPGITDWILWTRQILTKKDQAWFYKIKTKMHLHLWTSAHVDELLSGEALILKGTYFGELVLTPDNLAALHNAAVAPIRRRWQPEVHQTVDAERSLRQMLGEIGSWEHLHTVAEQISSDVAVFTAGANSLDGKAAEAAKSLLSAATSVSSALTQAHTALGKGDLYLLRQLLSSLPNDPEPEAATLPRKLRGMRHKCSLIAANTLSITRDGLEILNQLDLSLESRIAAVLAEAGCGKTQLAAQLTAGGGSKPPGILLHGRDLKAGGSLDDLAHRVKIAGVPVASIEALVAALDAAGQRAHQRLPIAIDGLNEAEDPRDWKALLATLREILSEYPYVLVVCTLRTAFRDESLPEDMTTLEISDFGHDTIAAIRKYFAYYKINATDAELPFELLRHPLTLRLFCEVTNPDRKQNVGIEAMPGSLTALFERYLERAAQRIADLAPRARRYYVPEVRTALVEIGTALWEEKSRSLAVGPLRERLSDTSRPWNESIVRALEQEGLLLRHPGDRITGVYDALSGHLIGDAILRKYDRSQLEDWLRTPSNISLLSGQLPDQHPLATDIFRALSGLLPGRHYGQQLWPLLQPPLRNAALRNAADLEGKHVDAATVKELGVMAATDGIERDNLVGRLFQTRGSPTHPLNAKFLDNALRSMRLPERDLRWTEWIRRTQEDRITDVDYLEERWRHAPQLDRDAEGLRARWVMWTLTSTVLEVRDKATRALYWYGRRDPQGLFILTLESLGFNDPYVPERMLAASYGTCMALHCRPNSQAFREKALSPFARRIYENIFAQSAPFSTTHVLARDFASGIVKLALLHNQSTLIQDEKARITPPFKEGGVRKWETLQDPNDEKYREGNSPIGMDFGNHTIGQLVPDRRTYDYEHPEYKQVVGQIIWRIYQLGYSLESFGEIDKNIAHSELYGRIRNQRITERYGKKYAQIAFFELYGLRQDEGLLKDRWDDEEETRTSEIDIDPSFPGVPHELRLVEDFLGNRSGDVANWVQRGPVPDPKPYLLRPEVLKAQGPWLLLDGHCSQEHKDAERRGFMTFQTFLILQDDVSDFVRLIRNQEPRGKWLPDAMDDHTVFAGEIPWSHMFRPDTLDTIDFVTGTVRKKVSKNDPRYNLTFVVDFEETKHVIGPTEPPAFEEVSVYKRIPVYIPVRGSSFSTHGPIERPTIHVPGKYIAQHFGLWLDLPTGVMRGASGNPCSISTAAGKFSDYERYLFIKKELIDQLLTSQQLTLFWFVRGERQHWGERHFRSTATSHGYKDYHQLYQYVQGKPLRAI